MIGLALPVFSIDVPVGLLEHRTELVQQLRRPFQGHRLVGVVLEELLQAAARHELHLDVAHRLRPPEVVDGHRVGMGDLGHQSGLALEPLPPLVVLGVLGPDELERAFALQRDVLDQPDLPHPPRADLLLEQVLTEDDLPLLDGRGGRDIPLVGPLSGGLGCDFLRIRRILRGRRGERGRGRLPPATVPRAGRKGSSVDPDAGSFRPAEAPGGIVGSTQSPWCQVSSSGSCVERSSFCAISMLPGGDPILPARTGAEVPGTGFARHLSPLRWRRVRHGESLHRPPEPRAVQALGSPHRSSVVRSHVADRGLLRGFIIYQGHPRLPSRTSQQDRNRRPTASQPSTSIKPRTAAPPRNPGTSQRATPTGSGIPEPPGIGPNPFGLGNPCRSHTSPGLLRAESSRTILEEAKVGWYSHGWVAGPAGDDRPS